MTAVNNPSGSATKKECYKCIVNTGCATGIIGPCLKVLNTYEVTGTIEGNLAVKRLLLL
jgi:hypothetical protein